MYTNVTIAVLLAIYILYLKVSAHLSARNTHSKSTKKKIQSWKKKPSPRSVSLRLTAPDGSSITETWDKPKAVAAGLWNGKDNWRKYPQAMLSARCITSAGRALAGEVMFGCYELDEADEIAGRRQPAPAAAPQAPAPATAAERVAAAIGGSVEAVTIDPEVAGLAKRVGDLAKNLGYSREAFFAFLAQRDLPAQRLTSFTVAQLEAMLEDLAIQAEESAEPEHAVE